MCADRSRRFTLPGLWKQIRDIRQAVGGLLSGYDGHVQNGAAVAVSELVENAIKYGVPVPEMPEVLVEVQIVGDLLAIRVHNGVENLDSVRRLQESVARVANEDPIQVFLERLDELSNNQSGSTGLGIYRTAAEGGFALRVEQKGDVVTVTAERSVVDGE